jgi:putative hemolysin
LLRGGRPDGGIGLIPDWWQAAGLLVLLGFSAFFSSSETALFSLPRSAIHAFGRSTRRGRREVVELLRRPRRLLVDILVGNTLVNIAAASLATAVTIDLLGGRDDPQAVESAVLWATLVMTAVILLVGEIVPKSYAIENAERLAPRLSFPLRLYRRIIAPVGVLLERLSDGIVSLLQTPGLTVTRLSTADLATAVELGHDEGSLDAFEREVVNNILEMEETTVGEVMTPRVEIESLDLGTPPEAWIPAFLESGYSRMPVVEGDPDRVAGVLYARDLLALRAHGTSIPGLRTLLREPFFVPESMRILELLHELRQRGLHFAVVIDEYGSVSGVVTMEDLLEEIVGDIADSRDEEEASFKLLEPGVAVVYAGLDLEDFARAVGLPLEDEWAETVGGWLINRLGRIPREGETLAMSPLRVHVLSGRANRVLWLRVEWKSS